MSCYLRHMGWLFEELDIAYDRPNRAVVDAAIREHLALAPDAHCPEAWAAVKELSDEGRAALVPELRHRLG